MTDFEGLIMKLEVWHWNSIMRKRILDVIELVGIVWRCTLNMSYFQDFATNHNYRYQFERSRSFDPASTLDFDPSPVANFGLGPAFDSDSDPFLDLSPSPSVQIRFRYQSRL
ncbi:hypothetical protein EVAR_32502_1 [Eumeta japonica]|uniref:Uncharacterized protein n=1 Tax=Eumeta variegata TaxID=151549 RepID=A0A4C1W7I6_EUMVA|nr:hypothetical protein EVAR_32502_1 [Eumeta japonica]